MHPCPISTYTGRPRETYISPLGHGPQTDLRSLTQAEATRCVFHLCFVTIAHPVLSLPPTVGSSDAFARQGCRRVGVICCSVGCQGKKQGAIPLCAVTW